MKTGVVCGVMVLVALAQSSDASRLTDVHNAELAEMFQQDQLDRSAGRGHIDWSTVKPRDDARLIRTRELYHGRQLRTGLDWFHAAVILQHSGESDDYLLAHEMSVAAVAMGEGQATSLVAATEDRFLMSIGRKQRFGTQRVVGANGSVRPAATDPQVTDDLRAALDVKPLNPPDPVEKHN